MPALPLTPRLLTRTFLSQPLRSSTLLPLRRPFSTSPANMGISTYFDVTWLGPVLDANSKPTKEVKGEIPVCHAPTQRHSSEPMKPATI